MQMKKFINKPEDLTPELLEGFVSANRDLVHLTGDKMVVNNKLAHADRVTLVAQGGGGHEPFISPFCGEGGGARSVGRDIVDAPGRVTLLGEYNLGDARYEYI